jgi:LuxR family maltose regulon positive regulatory protein
VHQGRLDDALDRCIRVAQRQEGYVDENLAARSHSISGKVFYERNDIERALNAMSQGISLRYDPAPFLLEMYPTLAYSHWAVGDGDAAQQAIEQSLAEWTGMQAENMTVWAWASRPILAHQARLALLEGRVEAASAWARNLERDKRDAIASRSQPPTYVSEWEDIVLARTYLSENRAHDALELLTRLDPEAEVAGRKARRLEILLLEVIAHDAEENTSTALLTLQQAIELAAPQRFVRAFVEGGPTIQRYLMRLHAECVARSPRIRWRRKTTLLHFIESLLTAFALQGKGGERGHTRHAGATPDSQGELMRKSPRLTRRQRQILRLVEDGATNRDIAADLVISPATVKRHISNIFTEMGVKNRTKAVTRALELGLLAPEANSEAAPDAGW